MAVTMVVEDGSGLSTANSYVTLAEALLYWENRKDTAWKAFSLGNEARSAGLIKATAYIEAHYRWKTGEIKTATQALGWPRVGAADAHDRDIGSSTIPQILKDAVCELAHKVAVSGTTLLADGSGQRVAAASVAGAVSVTYENVYGDTNRYKLVDQMLSPIAYGVNVQGEVIRG